MNETGQQRRRAESRLDRAALAALQLEKFNRQLGAILPENQFYATKFSGLPDHLDSLDQLAGFPFTTKQELVGDQPGEPGANLTYTRDRYVRFHQTSGTSGKPMIVLDTTEDWQWFVDTWQHVLDAADITSDDVLLMAFSFGPFIGFWAAHDAATERGCLVVPGGGMSTLARLEALRVARVTGLFCTPSYALHMAEVARNNKIDLRALELRCVLVAGEPGGSIQGVRERIERGFDARVIDHSGASEVGPWGYADTKRSGLHVVESEFIAEFISVETGKPAVNGELSELVLTNLGRYGFPVIRYRTGDMVRPLFSGAGENNFVLLEGGVLGRTDDMIIVRGVNIFPSSLEHILRGFDELDEFRITASKAGQMDQIEVEIEDQLNEPGRVAEALRLNLGLRIAVRCVVAGSLPRFEAKGKRFVDNR